MHVFTFFPSASSKTIKIKGGVPDAQYLEFSYAPVEASQHARNVKAGESVFMFFNETIASKLNTLMKKNIF